MFFGLWFYAKIKIFLLVNNLLFCWLNTKIELDLLTCEVFFISVETFTSK